MVDDAVDIKYLFNLEPKYYNELIRLINHDKNRSGFNRMKYKTSRFLDLSDENSEDNENNAPAENNQKDKDKDKGKDKGKKKVK